MGLTRDSVSGAFLGFHVGFCHADELELKPDSVLLFLKDTIGLGEQVWSKESISVFHFFFFPEWKIE